MGLFFIGWVIEVVGGFAGGLVGGFVVGTGLSWYCFIVLLCCFVLILHLFFLGY